MQDVTLIIAATTSMLVLFLPPVYGLMVYLATFAFYPTYLTIPIGTIDFTVCRIIIVAISAKLFLLTDLPNRFRFVWLDKIVIIYFAAQLLAGATTATSLTAFLENRGGAIFDWVLPYFAVRMIIQNKQQYLALLKAVLIIAAPLAVVGFYQCLTGKNPVGFLKEYYPWMTITGIPVRNEPVERMGLFRADVVFSHPILYGLFFTMFGPVCMGILAHTKKNKMFYCICFGLMGVGIFSSLSSGPILAAMLSISFIAFYRWRKHWKQVVIMIIIMCGLLEIISNTHFYWVINYFTFSRGTTWYRHRLISVALFEGGMSGHWLTGFGHGADLGWGPKIDGRIHTDMVNHYLWVLSNFGLVGLVPFFAMNIAVIRKLVDSYKASVLDSDKWLIWCLSAGFFGVAGASMATALGGSIITIYYMMIAFAGVMPAVVKKRSSLKGTRTDAGLSCNGQTMLSFNGSHIC